MAGSKDKGIDVDAVGTVNGVSVHEFDLDSVDDKPWRKPGKKCWTLFHISLNVRFQAENIHTLPKEGHWKFRGGDGSQKPKFLKENMKLNWNYQGGRVGSNHKTFCGGGGGEGYRYFLESHMHMSVLI